MHKGCSYTYPPLSIARYSFIQLSEMDQCRVTKLAQGFNPAGQDLNLGPLSRESDALLLSRCALRILLSYLSDVMNLCLTRWWGEELVVSLAMISPGHHHLFILIWYMWKIWEYFVSCARSLRQLLILANKEHSCLICFNVFSRILFLAVGIMLCRV